jgi:hypothetical protein
LSIYSNSWGDLSKCREDIKNNNFKVTSIISSPTILSKFDDSDYENMVYMAIGVERPYSKEDANELWRFVRYGGNIVLVDDFGYGNTFWDSVYNTNYGRAEFEKHQLFDQNYIKNTTFVYITATLPGPGKKYTLLLNEPTALDKSYGSTDFITLGTSSEGGWLDENGNRIRDPAEPRAPYPVIMYFTPGSNSGKVFVISDPGLFINDNWDKLNNSEYVLDMISYLIPNGGMVIFDESRHISENTFENTRRTLYSGIVFLTSTIWSIILMVIIFISFTLIIGARLKPQKSWKNTNLLGNNFFNVLNNPYITQSDYWQIYNTFLEKVRLHYDFTPDEFKDLDERTLYYLIDDDYLWDFITGKYPYVMDSNYYNFIIRMILDWKPTMPHKAEPKYDYEDNNESKEYEYYGGESDEVFKETGTKTAPVIVEPLGSEPEMEFIKEKDDSEFHDQVDESSGTSKGFRRWG